MSISVQIQKPKVLLIGAGGIGVEIIQNLIYMNLQQVTIIDFDTIEQSNLSRQFIFQKEDIGKYKSQIVAQYLQKHQKHQYQVQYEIASIFEDQFSIQFYMDYNIVINALDNLQARQHVFKHIYYINLLKHNIQFIDAGTAGLSGNIESISQYSNKHSYICCRKQRQEIIPICTLRNKPTKFEHCIAFGTEWIKRVIYNENNELNDIVPIYQILNQNELEKYLKSIVQPNYILNVQQRKLIQLYNQLNINDSYTTILKYLTQEQYFKQLKQEEGYNKDNQDSQLLLAAISYIRAYSFNIQTDQTPFQVQQIANKIIPAISFSNGLVANIACQLINNNTNQQVFVTNIMGLQHLIISDQQEIKTQECQFCSQTMLVINSKDVNNILELVGNSLYIFKFLDQDNHQILMNFNTEEDSGWDNSNSNSDKNNLQNEFQDKIKQLQKNILYRALNNDTNQIIYFSIIDNVETQVLQIQQILEQNSNIIDLSSSISIY